MFRSVPLKTPLYRSKPFRTVTPLSAAQDHYSAQCRSKSLFIAQNRSLPFRTIIPLSAAQNHPSLFRTTIALTTAHFTILNFLQVDEELRTYGSATELTGSTASVILIKHGELICANLGDSRAIASLSGLVKPLSTDHNTSNSQERERVFSMGGTIKENRYFTLHYLINEQTR